MLVVCFAALFAQLNWLQLFGADELEDNPDNTTAIIRDFGRDRGTIVTADGVVVARVASRSRTTNSGRERRYPEGELYAHITGAQLVQPRRHGRRARSTTTSWPVRPTSSSSVQSRRPLRRPGPHGQPVSSPSATTSSEVAREALGDAAGLGGGARPPRRCDPRHVDRSRRFDPNLVEPIDLDAATAAVPGRLRRQIPTTPLLRQGLPRAFFPGSTFKVVTGGPPASRSGVATADRPVFPAIKRLHPAAHHVAHPQLRGIDLWRRPARGPAGVAATRPSPRWAPSTWSVPSPMIGTAEAFGFNDVPPDRSPRLRPPRASPPTSVQCCRPAPETSDVPIVENTPRWPRRRSARTT